MWLLIKAILYHLMKSLLYIEGTDQSLWREERLEWSNKVNILYLLGISTTVLEPGRKQKVKDGSKRRHILTLVRNR